MARACSPIFSRGVDCREAFDDKRKENIRSCTTHCTEDACNHAPSNIPVNHMLILLAAFLFRDHGPNIFPVNHILMLLSNGYVDNTCVTTPRPPPPPPSTIPYNHILKSLVAIFYGLRLQPRPLTTYLSIIFNDHFLNLYRLPNRRIHGPFLGSILGQRCRQRPNIEPISDQCIVC